MEKYYWDIPADVDYLKLDKEYLKTSLDLAEKELKGAIEVSSNATNRGYQALIAIVPTTTLLVSTLLKMVLEKKLDIAFGIAFVFVITHLVISFKHLFEVIFPRDMFNIGNQPELFFKKEYMHLENEGDKDAALKMLLAINLEHYQYRINYMHAQNAERVSKVKAAFEQLRFVFFELLAYIIFLSSVWALEVAV